MPKPAASESPAIKQETPINAAQLEAIQKLTNKINELTFDTRSDALDILRDIQSKVEKNENVSKYQLDGLQAALKDQSSVTEELNQLVGLFKK